MSINNVRKEETEVNSTKYLTILENAILVYFFNLNNFSHWTERFNFHSESENKIIFLFSNNFKIIEITFISLVLIN